MTADRPATEPRTETAKRIVNYLRSQGLNADPNIAPQAKSAYLSAARSVEVAAVRIEDEAAQGAAPRTEGLAERLAEAIASLPDDEWVLMLGHEKYDPIPGSPGDVNHPGLAGQMIWWASTRRSDPEPGVPLVIVSAERHPSPEAALHDLAGQMRRRYPASRPKAAPASVQRPGGPS